MASDAAQGPPLGAAAHFRALAETAPDAIVTADATNRIAYVNPAAERMFGRSAADALGQPLTILMPERMRAAHSAGFARYVETGDGPLVGTTVEVVAVDADGCEFPIELSLGSAGDGTGRTFTAVIRDLTERKRRERHLAAQLAVTRVLAASGSTAHTGEGILREMARELGCDLGLLWLRAGGRLRLEQSWQADPEATRSFVEASAELTFGPGEGVPGKVLAEGRPDWRTDLAADERLIRRDSAREAGLTTGIWLPLPSEQSVVGVVELFARTPLAVDDALRDLLMTVASQVGEHVQRLQAQQQLEEARELFTNAFVHAPTGMALVDTEGRWLEVNPALCRLTGYREEELLSRRFDDVTHPEDLDADRAHVARVLAGEIDSYELEKRYLRPGGDVLWARLSVSVVRHPGDPYFIAQIQDVSADREAALLREERAEALRRSNLELEQFAHVAAHDLRTPLRTVAGFAELILRRHGDELHEEVREQIEMIAGSADKAGTMLESLLEHARAAGRRPARERVELSAVVADALAAVRADIDARDAEIVVEKLPVVLGDRVQLAQVLQNLVANAVKFTPDDRRPEVRVDGRRDGAWVVLAVNDNGIGVDPDEADALFTMFRRSSRSGDYAGTGVGLAICARIVGAHGGRIGVRSAPGGGSRFELTLPAADG